MTKEEILAEATSVLRQPTSKLSKPELLEALQAYAATFRKELFRRGVETHEVIGIVLLLRDVLARSLFAKTRPIRKLNRILDAYEPAQTDRQHRGRRFRARPRARYSSPQKPFANSPPRSAGRERLLILPSSASSIPSGRAS